MINKKLLLAELRNRRKSLLEMANWFDSPDECPQVVVVHPLIKGKAVTAGFVCRRVSEAVSEVIEEMEKDVETNSTATGLTASGLVAAFPNMVINSNVLEDIACPQCGQRNYFVIDGSTAFEVTDDGSDGNCGDHEWDDESYCRCQQCNHDGKLLNFTFNGLDDQLRAAREKE